MAACRRFHGGRTDNALSHFVDELTETVRNRGRDPCADRVYDLRYSELIMLTQHNTRSSYPRLAEAAFAAGTMSCPKGDLMKVAWNDSKAALAERCVR